jgi:membrane protein DedA with SNARE-associated domain
VAYLNKIPTGPKFLAADFLSAVVWVWIYVGDHKHKQITSTWLGLELAVALISSFFLLLQLVTVYVKWQGRTAKDSCLT